MSEPGENGVQLKYAVRRPDFILDAALDLPSQGVTGVFGPSGAGKSTLLRCIAGLEHANHAQLEIGGEVVDDANRGIARPPHARHIAYVFQRARLFPHLTVRRNLEYGMRRARTGTNLNDFDSVVALLGLSELLDRRPSTLSGGETQRVAIGRALLSSPRLLLMDEPLASLDRRIKEQVLPYIERLCTTLAIPIVYVSHNIDEICRLSDYLVVLEGGAVVAQGEPQDVLTHTGIPIIANEEAGTVIRAHVASYDESSDLACASISGGELLIAGRQPRADLKVRIRANDVSLCLSRPTDSTILNILDATIDEVLPENASTALVRLRLGDDFVLARVTKRSVDALGLQPGEAVFAQIKSVAVR